MLQSTGGMKPVFINLCVSSDDDDDKRDPPTVVDICSSSGDESDNNSVKPEKEVPVKKKPTKEDTQDVVDLCESSDDELGNNPPDTPTTTVVHGKAVGEARKPAQTQQDPAQTQDGTTHVELVYDPAALERQFFGIRCASGNNGEDAILKYKASLETLIATGVTPTGWTKDKLIEYVVENSEDKILRGGGLMVVLVPESKQVFLTFDFGAGTLSDTWVDLRNLVNADSIWFLSEQAKKHIIGKANSLKIKTDMRRYTRRCAIGLHKLEPDKSAAVLKLIKSQAIPSTQVLCYECSAQKWRQPFFWSEHGLPSTNRGTPLLTMGLPDEMHPVMQYMMDTSKERKPPEHALTPLHICLLQLLKFQGMTTNSLHKLPETQLMGKDQIRMEFRMQWGVPPQEFFDALWPLLADAFKHVFPHLKGKGVANEVVKVKKATAPNSDGRYDVEIGNKLSEDVSQQDAANQLQDYFDTVENGTTVILVTNVGGGTHALTGLMQKAGQGTKCTVSDGHLTFEDFKATPLGCVMQLMRDFSMKYAVDRWIGQEQEKSCVALAAVQAAAQWFIEQPTFDSIRHLFTPRIHIIIRICMGMFFAALGMKQYVNNSHYQREPFCAKRKRDDQSDNNTKRRRKDQSHTNTRRKRKREQ